MPPADVIVRATDEHASREADNLDPKGDLPDVSELPEQHELEMIMEQEVPEGPTVTRWEDWAYVGDEDPSY